MGKIEGTRVMSQVEFVDELPPSTRASQLQQDLEPVMAELTENPGKWGKIAEGKNVSALAGNLKARYADEFEFATRGGTLYAKAVSLE